MKILITGYNGFVGSNLTKILSLHQLFFVDRVGMKTEMLHFNWDNLQDCVNIDCIIHLAGKAHDTKNVSSESEYFEVNLGLTQSIFDYFLKSSASKFIFLSSVKSVVDSVTGVLTEESIGEPRTPYGKSKIKAENYILRDPLPKNKKIYILRPCMIHGAGNKGNLNLLYNVVSKGIPYPLASFSNKRSFLSVENLCFIIKEILEREDIPSGIYNVADDEPLSTNEVVTLLAKAQNRSPRLLNIPQNMIRIVAKIGDKLRLPLNTERLQKLTENFVVSNDKIKSVLKKELPLSAREGILKTARSFKNA